MKISHSILAKKPVGRCFQSPGGNQVGDVQRKEISRFLKEWLTGVI